MEKTKKYKQNLSFMVIMVNNGIIQAKRWVYNVNIIYRKML